MLDLKMIRNHTDEVKEKLATRGFNQKRLTSYWQRITNAGS